jgi:hypothetical protein
MSPTVQGRLNDLPIELEAHKEQFCALYIKHRILYSVVSAVLGLSAGRWFTNE